MIFYFLKDLFFPKFCLQCYRPGSYLCQNCQKQLIYLRNQRCFYCKKPSPYSLTHQKCLKSFYIDQVGSIFIYNNLLKKIIKNIKYRFATEVFKELTLIIDPKKINTLSFYKNLSGNITIQPIPLHKNKYKKRGFNQAYLISLYLQKFLNFPIVDYLERVKETKNQAEIKEKKQRYQNLKGAFKIRQNLKQEELKNLKIILVDDIITTGYTANEAAKTLKKAGCEKVYLFSLAQG